MIIGTKPYLLFDGDQFSSQEPITGKSESAGSPCRSGSRRALEIKYESCRDLKFSS